MPAVTYTYPLNPNVLLVDRWSAGAQWSVRYNLTAAVVANVIVILQVMTYEVTIRPKVR